ncbi:MAG: tripartite tricarboxylate transporter permease [Desulfocucumaceae bacterium]
MDILYHLGMGFIHSLSPVTLMLLVMGVLIGLITGILPGLTVVMGVILVLPFTYPMDATNAIIVLTAIYIGGTYGGAFTSILFKIPGEPIHVPLLWDGYPMARKGQAAKALGWTLYGAIGGGLVAAIIMVIVSEPFAKVALSFSTPEYFAIVFLGLTSVIVLGTSTVRQAVVSLAIGLLVSTVGVDDVYGSERFTFGSAILRDGIDYLTVMVGTYAVAEVLTRLEEGFVSPTLQQIGKVKTTFPTWLEFRQRIGLFLRSIGIGTIIGAVPGAGATVASFVSYGIEKQYGKNRKEMGKGAPEGILSSQTAATASVGGALIPLLTLGIPGSGCTAVILGAFLLHGIQPGPQVFATSLDMVYTIYASVFLALAIMAVIGYLAVKPMCKVLDAPESVSSAFIMVLCFIGAFTIRNNISDVWMMVVFGLIGYIMERYNYPIAPLVLGAILGPLAERAFMTTMISFSNDWTVFFTRPISGVIMFISILSLLFTIVYPMLQKRRQDQASLEQ